MSHSISTDGVRVETGEKKERRKQGKNQEKDARKETERWSHKSWALFFHWTF